MKVADIQKKSIPILKRRFVRRAGIFGSSARNDPNPRDIDMLVEMPRPYGLFSFLSLKNELEETLATKVDLIEYGTLKAKIKDRVLEEEVRIL